MTEEERKVLADKVKNKTATEEETIMFINEFTRLVAELNKELKS